MMEFHDLEIGDFFMFEIKKLPKSFPRNGPFIKTGFFSFSYVNEYGESTGVVFPGKWHDPIKIITKDEAIMENNNYVLATVLN